MLAKSRFVFDTNATVSAALIKRSISHRAFDKALDGGKLLVSAKTIEELNDVLGRPDFAKYLTEEERLEFLTVLLRETELVAVANHVDACRDARDNKFLELAVSGGADCIIGGDQDLLVWTSQNAGCPGSRKGNGC
jgi:uncharacterized protein